MKINKLYILILIVISCSFYNCKPTFLESGGDSFLQLEDTLFMSNDKTIDNLPVDLPVFGSANYTIIRFPNWMKLSSFQGVSTRGVAYLSFITKNTEATKAYGLYNGQVEFKVDGYGLVRLIVQYGNFGFPQIFVSTSLVEMGLGTEKEFTITNTSEGILYWQLANNPAWLKFSRMSGTLLKNETVTIKAIVSRQGLQKGDYTERFSIINNSASGQVDVFITMKVAN